jgi:pectate lyase
VVEVVNLEDSGAGSFRAACESSGPRIVVFRVGGIIELEDPIRIDDPYITIAGQTAPGGGVLVKGNEIAIQTHDVIVRFLRVRLGRQDDFAHQQGDCFVLRSGCDKVMIDHCSVSWSNDENISIWSGKPAAHNVTFSWNLIAEGLTYDHASCGLIVGSNVDSVGIHSISIHHNAFLHGNNRFPLVKCRDARIINNLMYNWNWWPTGVSGGIKVDIIGNLYKIGPNTPESRTH